MKVINRFLAGLFCLAGTAFFITAIFDLSSLLTSASSFRLHHEVTGPLCYLLSKFIFGLFFAILALAAAGRHKAMDFDPAIDLPALSFVGFLFWITGIVMENEAFLTLYDNKTLPVHPTEIVMHPIGAWLTAWDHVALCLAGIVGAVVFFAWSKAGEKTQL